MATKLGCAFLVLSAMISLAVAVQVYLPPAAKPLKYYYYQGCYSAELDVMLSPEVFSQPLNGLCQQYYCFDQGTILKYTCDDPPPPQFSVGCTVLQNISLPYPNCCPQTACVA